MPLIPLHAEFEIRPPNSPSADRIARSFGLGRELTRHSVWTGQSVDASPGKLLLFTGRSGSGKSTALNLIADHFAALGGTVERLDRQSLAAGLPLIDQLPNPNSPISNLQSSMHETSDREQISDREQTSDPHSDLQFAIGNSQFAMADPLARAGLSDARLWLLPPEHLSDGQRFRAKLAKLYVALETAPTDKPRVALLDEFAAALDRDSARTVCLNLRRTVTSIGLVAAVATTHEDVSNWLVPDEWWHRPDSLTAVRRTVDPADTPHSETDTPHSAFRTPHFPVIEIPARRAWEFLQGRHYKDGRVPGTVRAYGLFEGERLLGALTLSHPPPSLQAHLVCGANFFRTGRTAIARIRETLQITRVAVDDAHRGAGLGKLLIRRAIELCGARTVMVVAAMARHNLVFLAAGMKPAGTSRSGNPVFMKYEVGSTK